ncbi:hypothetical protein SARC_10318 [Sphaeroforma arctica JP610]|uniref:Uncharacterized protein n=1 Tax=Sphaeroforma arctica JP610 TaxID=667725 RepID=A0A0L0FKB6_9EUKA|nr:hypothetical protein SARC_10318 [Sphaeroforma arctica JP610]KNC77217.1 hypothetical protein SARC_10318 [Sphaeroforma arctica JP610]|eukprot:XP_014151119.1 hypothetical protein SARC_10318 [Sphaeroforma arctica JP610]
MSCAVETPIETLLYGHKFLARPFRLKSQATRDCERQPETCEQHITITTQGTWNRHDTLLHLASIWKGPISFALLVNTDREAAEAVAMCQDVPNCRQYIDLHISVRAGHVAEHTGSFYPINYLRNLAMHNVRTKLLYQLDVDNLPNESHAQYVVWMTAAMADPDVMDADTSADCPGLHVFVPPAFEMTADDLNTIVTLKDGSPTIPKKALVDAALSGVALPMHGYYPPAYGPTGHNAWLTSGQTVRLNYVTRFEPYYIASVPVPLFNETFVNRGGNYAQQVYEMAAAGYSFWRLPQAFIIDIPHSKATCAHAAHDDAEPGTTGVLADIHQDDIGDTETATETSDNSDTNKDTNSATASAAVLVMSNESGQLDQTGALVSSLWLNFWEHICHRYGTHAPHPDSKEPYFADYRLSLGDLFSAQKLRLDTVPMVEPSTDSRRDEHR